MENNKITFDEFKKWKLNVPLPMLRALCEHSVCDFLQINKI